jgi:uncharacterized protein
LIEYRKTHGLFKERDELMKVPQLSSKVFEQAAGFLRVQDSKTVLDRTGIHPERYSAVREMAQELGVNVTALIGSGAHALKPLREKWAKLIGEYTFDDIVRELEKPGRDPRDMFKVFQYRDDIHELKDLKAGMICPGIVTNVTNFGAFVDIGVHQDGLVHISELSWQFVDDPRKVVSPGDNVQVKVVAVDLDKNQISLSMKTEERPKAEARPRPPQQPHQPQGERKPRQAREGGGGPRPGGGEKPRGPRLSHGGRDAQRGNDRRDNRGPGGGKGGGGQRPQQPARPAGKPFNNPFAALTGLKDE